MAIRLAVCVVGTALAGIIEAEAGPRSAFCP